VSASRPVLYGDARRWGLVQGDALALLANLPSSCVDAIVTDPPYGIGFHGEAWDGENIHRSVSPGEELSVPEAFARWTRMWASECRRVLKPGGQMVAFGCPRTFHRLTSGIEDAGLDVRDVLLWLNDQGVPKSRRLPGGRGTALKPAYEPILLCRTPIKGGVVGNAEVWGTGALNIDAARVPARAAPGYWPANLALSHAPGCPEEEGGCVAGCPVGMIDRAAPRKQPSRFFYCAKVSREEREAGCEQLPEQAIPIYTGDKRKGRRVRNIHPTVKPIDLMRWLVRLTCPPGGVVLDPFAGSASTGAAAMLEGRQFFGIERERQYVGVAIARLEYWAQVAAGAA
jgi:DNA modification methylase